MKNWNEAREGMVVYIVNEIEVSDADNVLIGKTKPFQKAEISGYTGSNEIMIIVNGGEFDEEEFYFNTKTDSPLELLTTKEFKEIKMTEVKVWKDLKKFINVINKLKEKSDDILMIREIIERHNK